MFKIAKHYGKSVFKWRVYRVFKNDRVTQLGKYRTREAAEKALAFWQEREATKIS